MINILFCLEPFEPSVSGPPDPTSKKSLMYPLLLTYASKVAISIITQFPKPSLALSPNMPILLFLEDTSRFAKHGLFLTLKTLVTNMHLNSNVTAPGLCASASLLSGHVAPGQGLVGLHWPEHSTLQVHPTPTCLLEITDVYKKPQTILGSTCISHHVYLDEDRKGENVIMSSLQRSTSHSRYFQAH